MKQVANNIKTLRKAAGWSQHRLAKEAGVTQATICYAERDDRRTGIDVLQAIARALGVTLCELVGDAPPEARAYKEFYLRFKKIDELSEEKQGVILELLRTM